MKTFVNTVPASESAEEATMVEQLTTLARELSVKHGMPMCAALEIINAVILLVKTEADKTD